jgi:hypothetical protein
MGPFPLSNEHGMQAAIAPLDRSLDPGCHTEYVQFGTFRKVRLMITNIIQAGVDGLGDLVGAYQRNTIWVTKASTQKYWFSRCMEGLHKHGGEIRMVDKILTIEEVLTIDRMMEQEWKHLQTKIDKNVFPKWAHGAVEGCAPG